MADLRDFTGKNRKFTGTIGERISTGTTAERDVATFGAGTIRFNTTTNLMEYYTGTEWKSIDAPPVITGFKVNGGATVTSGEVDNEASGNVTIEIIGSLFDTTGGNVTFIGTSETLTPVIQTRNSGNLFTVQLPHSSFDDANSPYTIRMTNGSGLSAELTGAISSDQTGPVFITAAGTLGTITNTTRSSYTLSSAAATDPDGDTITYSISAGSLPAGLSINSATGAITGTASAVASNTTSTFTVSAATTQFTSTRQFSITVNAPIVESFTSTGAFTFSVPSGVSSVEVLAVAGGGGSAWIGGGGGGGGVVYHTSFPVTPGGTVPGSVGAGGPNAPGSVHNNQGPFNGRGGDSTFGSLTAKGGGSTSGWNQASAQGGAGATSPFSPGGSGGGGSHYMNGGAATQPGTSNPGATNYGFPGAAGGDHPSSPASDNGTTYSGQHSNGGGGGAGTAGGHPSQNGPGNTTTNQQAGTFGGSGVANSITGSPVIYGGGGAGAGHGPAGQGYSPNSDGLQIGGPGGGGNSGPSGTPGTPGTANRGGGGGGGYYPDLNGGTGGSGIVIVKY